MSETFFFIITAVLTFTLCQINGQKGTCQYNDSIPVGGVCYRRNFTQVTWMEAKDSCESWNGTLAMMTSLRHMVEVFSAIGMNSRFVWVDTIDGDHDVLAYHSNFYDLLEYTAQPCDTGNVWNAFLCMEISNKMSLNTATLSTTTNVTTEVVLTSEESNAGKKKETCLDDNAFLVDGQCYRLSDKEIPWSDKLTYCKGLNSTVATISSLTQGANILKNISKYDTDIWVNDLSKDNKEKYANSFKSDNCQMFQLIYTDTPDSNKLVLCVQKALSSSDAFESTTTAASTTSPALTTTPGLTINLESTSTPSMPTTPKSTFKTRIQDSNNRKELNKPELKKILETNSGMYISLKLGLAVKKLF